MVTTEKIKGQPTDKMSNITANWGNESNRWELWYKAVIIALGCQKGAVMLGPTARHCLEKKRGKKDNERGGKKGEK